jgi:hypothetical protein
VTLELFIVIGHKKVQTKEPKQSFRIPLGRTQRGLSIDVIGSGVR